MSVQEGSHAGLANGTFQSIVNFKVWRRRRFDRQSLCTHYFPSSFPCRNKIVYSPAPQHFDTLNFCARFLLHFWLHGGLEVSNEPLFCLFISERKRRDNKKMGYFQKTIKLGAEHCSLFWSFKKWKVYFQFLKLSTTFWGNFQQNCSRTKKFLELQKIIPC